MPPVSQQASVTDIVGLCVFLAALVFSDEVAAVVGPYIVILAAASIGASFAVARRERTSRGAAVWFFTRVCGLAVLLTAGLAAWASTYYPDLNERLLLAPIALMVGFVGDRWPSVLNRVLRACLGLLDLLRGGPKGGPQ